MHRSESTSTSEATDTTTECETPDEDSTERPAKKRTTANRKERKRTQTMNSAFEDLRQHIPNVPVDTKLSKIKTLRLAISYIRYLNEVLEETKDGKPCTRKNFVVEMALQSDMKEKRRREECSADLSPRKRGRTGWPQQVWAMELRQ
ncbi:heart- and neural crest derivatives-expressed protein 2-like [Actinia tenebrosa]|uniref:Heart- and neural crest derivatives-expressed protein 2-like n=1 Tax=Actinia tenebrosa TaxID=6105 RepID=A0A6P8H0T3_ACTTE|nr:heart- and neural crest derivatives-expressed protein 2-like [Actinia tenebrosa]